MSESIILEGHVSVEAALEARSRKVAEVLIRRNKSRRDTTRLEHLARRDRVTVRRVDGVEIDALVSGKTHGGVIARAGERRLLALGDLLVGADPALVVMLDGVEDPFNFGYALRSLYAAGVSGVVVRQRDWTTAAGVVARASAGASERVKMAAADSALEAAAFYREKGLTVACTARQGATSMFEADLSQPMFLLIGGEKRGVTRSFVEEANLLLSIPYGRRFDASLSAGGATAAIAFEALRQRRESINRRV